MIAAARRHWALATFWIVVAALIALRVALPTPPPASALSQEAATR